MFRLVTPDLRVESVLDLGVEQLRCLGIESLLLDVDCTLKNYCAVCLTPEVIEWLRQLRDAGFGLCLVTNGRGSRLNGLAESLSIPIVCEACKPLPFGLRKAIRQLGFDPKRTAMVGDQLFADVMAGRMAGLTTILVRPTSPNEEPWFTRMKRPFERALLRRIDCKIPK